MAEGLKPARSTPAAAAHSVSVSRRTPEIRLPESPHRGRACLRVPGISWISMVVAASRAGVVNDLKPWFRSARRRLAGCIAPHGVGTQRARRAVWATTHGRPRAMRGSHRNGPGGRSAGRGHGFDREMRWRSPGPRQLEFEHVRNVARSPEAGAVQAAVEGVEEDGCGGPWGTEHEPQCGQRLIAVSSCPRRRRWSEAARCRR